MDGSFEERAQQLATEFAGQATTVEELNGLMRLMLKSGLERMLDTELDVHLGRRPGVATETAANEAATLVADASPAGKKNRRNGHSPKTIKAIWAKSPSTRPATATAPSSRN